MEVGLSLALLVAILVVLQVVVERHGARLDLTPSRSLSISDATRRIVAEVEDELRIEAYYARWRRDEIADLLARLAAASPRVRYELFDIDRYPERARAAGITEADRARLIYRGAETVVSTASEEYLAGGIVRVLRGRARRVYFLRGHGERDGSDPRAERGYFAAVKALERENTVAAPLELTTSLAVPADADAVVVAGATRDLFLEESAALARYVDAGGSVLILLEPGPLPQWTALLARYGVDIVDDLIVDDANRILGAESLAVRVPYYRMHPVTAPSDVPALLVGARTVAVARETRDAQTVARSVESAWATREIEAARRGEARFLAERDVPGPLPVMAVVATAPATSGRRGGRLVVIGDADFAAADYIDLVGNRDLLLNSLAWLTDEETLIARRPRELAEIARPLSPLVLTERQAHMLFVLIVLVEPALLLAIGATIVVRRRRRG